MDLEASIDPVIKKDPIAKQIDDLQAQITPLEEQIEALTSQQANIKANTLLDTITPELPFEVDGGAFVATIETAEIYGNGVILRGTANDKAFEWIITNPPLNEDEAGQIDPLATVTENITDISKDIGIIDEAL